ncbi:LysM peptidoglycan-binding domain-containing protein [Jiulongibacter sp. NS-SX5]|uniref:LysM peptidoglycan-binding domain-containing protein n=1 Tax=Jiulongibacter sp. NS-SX5 TaxID=3463854 RepID=UPI004059328C
MKTIAITAILSLLIINANAFQTTITDSLVTRTTVSSSVIHHEVKPKETLYSLLRAYDCTASEFHKLNPQLNGGHNLKVKQIIKFPGKTERVVIIEEEKSVNEGRSVREVNEVSEPEAPKEEKAKRMITIHKVQPGQTLFSISQIYGASIDEIKAMNNLADNSISVGQPIRVKTTSDHYDAASRTLYPPNLTPDIIPTSVVVPNAPRGESISEHGIAEVISSSRTNSSKLLALHKTAPLGSLMVVQNEATKNQVIVKVIGKLPETGNNENILVRLSPEAFYRLNPKDIRIRAKVTYYLPPNS